MDILPDDKNFKNYDERILNTQSISHIKSVNIILMVVLTLITLGIYPAYWFYKRTKEVNLLYSKHIIKKNFIILFFVFFTINLGMSIIDILCEGMINEIIVKILGKIVTFMFFFWVFFLRNRLNAIIGAKPQDKEWFKGVWTFFFNLFYIQYKINLINKTKTETH